MTGASRRPGCDAYPMIEAFPMPGPLVEGAYTPLDKAAERPPDKQNIDPRLALRSRPWDPASCREPELRAELWDWLERVVIWLNREYVWDTTGVIPACWPRHPHLVHEIAVVADRRRQAGLAVTGADLAEFHRSTLPDFIDRMQVRLRSHCEDREHQAWPARGRFVRHCASETVEVRRRIFAADVRALVEQEPTEDGVADLDPEERRAQIRGLPSLADEDDTGWSLD